MSRWCKNTKTLKTVSTYGNKKKLIIIYSLIVNNWWKILKLWYCKFSLELISTDFFFFRTKTNQLCYYSLNNCVITHIRTEIFLLWKRRFKKISTDSSTKVLTTKTVHGLLNCSSLTHSLYNGRRSTQSPVLIDWDLIVCVLKQNIYILLHIYSRKCHIIVYVYM